MQIQLTTKSAHEQDLAAFDKAVAAQVQAIDDYERQSVEDALKLLELLRGEITAAIQRGGDSAFDLNRMRQVQAAVRQRIQHFQLKLDNQMQADLNATFNLGVNMMDEPLRAAGFQPAFIGISREAVQVAAQFSADLIQSLTNDIRSSINAILRKAVNGVFTVQQAIDAVGQSLDSEGAFRSIAARAETIVRTEVLRIQSIATQARMQAQRIAVQAAGYELQKQWLTAGDDRVRDAHVEAEGQTKNVEDSFDVDGEDLLYPRDPAGSPDNTINCRCQSIPVISPGG